jgi:hypothetical protein
MLFAVQTARTTLLGKANRFQFETKQEHAFQIL